MEKQYDNTNTGAIFVNDKKGNEKAPAWKGTINVEGKDYEIALWERTASKSGKNFLSAKIQVAKPKAETFVKNQETDLPF